MSEYASGINNVEQKSLPGLELISFIEMMSPGERVEYKDKLLSEISDREYLVHLINEVNDIEKMEC